MLFLTWEETDTVDMDGSAAAPAEVRLPARWVLPASSGERESRAETMQTNREESKLQDEFGPGLLGPPGPGLGPPALTC